MKRIKEVEIIENTKMHFPEGISKEIDDYVINDLLIESRYLFVENHKGIKKAFCTHCKKTQDADGLKHKETFACVHCKSICKVQFSGYSRTKMIDDAYFVYYEKSEINKEAIIARGFDVIMDFTGDYKNVRPQYEVIGMYLFEMNNPVFLKKDIWYEDKPMELRKSVFSLFEDYSMFGMPSTKLQDFSRESIESAVEGTPFQYSMWHTRYGNVFDDYTRYFATYAKWPQIEYLSKLGFGDFVERKVAGASVGNTIYWRGNTLPKMFRLPKQIVNEIIKRAVSIDPVALKMIQENHREQFGLKVDEILDIKYSGITDYDWNIMKELARKSSMKRVINYLKRQMDNENEAVDPGGYTEETLGLWSTLILLKDYHDGCRELELRPGKDIALFPSNLRRAHDDINSQVEFKEDEKLRKEFAERYEELQEYVFESETLIVLPFATQDEIFEEGKVLKHCVGNYAKSYAQGRTDLFRIRRKSDINTPFYTMEVQDGKVRQYYGYENNNKIPKSEEVIAFVEQFEKEVLNKKENAA